MSNKFEEVTDGKYSFEKSLLVSLEGHHVLFLVFGLLTLVTVTLLVVNVGGLLSVTIPPAVLPFSFLGMMSFAFNRLEKRFKNDEWRLVAKLFAALPFCIGVYLLSDSYFRFPRMWGFLLALVAGFGGYFVTTSLVGLGQRLLAIPEYLRSLVQ